MEVRFLRFECGIKDQLKIFQAYIYVYSHLFLRVLKKSVSYFILKMSHLFSSYGKAYIHPVKNFNY